MSASNSPSRRPPAIGIIAFVSGLLLGLIILGWWVWPVQWTDSYPEYMRSDIQADYLRMAVDSYSVNQDIDAARQRYAWLGAAGPALLADLQASPGDQDPAAIAAFAEVVAGADAQAAQPEANNAINGLRGVLLFAIVAAVLAFIVYRFVRWRGRSQASPKAPALTTRTDTEEAGLDSANFEMMSSDLGSYTDSTPGVQAPGLAQADTFEDAGPASLSSVALAGLAASATREGEVEPASDNESRPGSEALGLASGTEDVRETQDGSGPQTAQRRTAKMTGDTSYVEGIGSTYSERLREAGIRSPEALLEQGSTPKGRAKLAAASGISEKLILKWVNHVDFYRIKGIGSEYADLLEASGVDTVVELAHRNPVNLLEHLIQVNQQKKLVRQPPRLAQVVDWIAQAKSLPRVITY